MLKTLLFVLVFAFCLTSVSWAQVVLGIEANGADSATIKAYEWRKTNVYEGVYAKAGFKVVLISQSSKAKVEEALKNDKVTHITGCGHGNTTIYTGYNQGVVFSSTDTELLKKLAGMNIHLLSCLTAQELGPAMISARARSYAGYYPSFYFTWKSTGLFFEADAEMDKAFAQGKTAPQGFEQTIKKFNEILEILNKQDPDGVKYIIIDRDGLRCMPPKRTELDYVLPLDIASKTLFAKNPETGEFVSYADFQNLGLRSSHRDMSNEEFKEMVIAGYEKLDRDFEVGVISFGRFHRDQIIDEIRRDTEVGKQFLEIDRYFVNKLEQSRWSKTVEVSTDATGTVNYSGNVDIPMTITTKEVKGSWVGEPNSFPVTFVLNNETLFNGVVTNGQSYSISKQIKKGPASVMINASGCPKNTKIKITLYFSLG